MENALWKGKHLFASVIADDYDLEKEIRKASESKELRCPDPECRSSIVKYCHGNVKEAYFSHVSNAHCDYADFDLENSQVMRYIRKRLYDSFVSRGFHVQAEVKLLEHHYTGLLFDFPDDNKIALEFKTKHISEKQYNSLVEQYMKIGIAVKWIVLDDCGLLADKDLGKWNIYHILRDCNYVIIEPNNEKVVQLKADMEKYDLSKLTKYADEYPDIYREEGSFDELTFEDNNITFAGYDKRYFDWHERKCRVLK